MDDTVISLVAQLAQATPAYVMVLYLIIEVRQLRDELKESRQAHMETLRLIAGIKSHVPQVTAPGKGETD